MKELEVIFNGKKLIGLPNPAIWVFIVFMSLPHIMNKGYLLSIDWVNSILDVWRLFTFLIILFLYILQKKIPMLPSIIIIIIQAYLLLNTAIQNPSNAFDVFKSAFSCISVILITDFFVADGTVFFSSELFCFEIMIYINFISVLLFPNGNMYIMDTFEGHQFHINYFLGYYNGYSVYFIPALLIAFIYMYESGKKSRCLALTIVIYATAFLVRGGGQLVALLIMGILYVFALNKTIITNYYSSWLTHIVFFISVIILKLQNVVIDIVLNVLNRQRSFSGRIQVWENAWQIIKDRIIVGYGVRSGEENVAIFRSNWMIHAHNQLLNILYQGGIIYLILFTLLILSCRKLFDYRSEYEAKIISIAFIGWSIHSLVEPFVTPFLLSIFIIAYYYCEGLYDKGLLISEVEKTSRFM